MGRKKLDLTPEQIAEREEKTRQKKAEWARNNRKKTKETVVPMNDFMLNFQTPPPAPEPKEIDTVSVNGLFEEVPIKPFDLSKFSSQMDKFKQSFMGVKQELPAELPPPPTEEGVLGSIKSMISKVKNFTAPSLPQTVYSEEDERKMLVDRYIMIAEKMPEQDFVVPEKIKKMSRDLSKIDINELRLTVSYMEKKQLKGIDSELAKKTLELSTMAVGKMLNCYDNLEKEVKNDEYLKDVTSTFMSSKILDMVPDALKIAGLFGKHVLVAYRGSSSQPAITPLEKIAEQKKKEEIAEVAEIQASKPKPQEDDRPLFEHPSGFALRARTQ